MSLTALLSLAVVHPAWAQQSIHHVDIETLGVFRRIADAAEGPAGEFDDADWLQQDAGMSAASYRYELAFAAYGVAALAQRTPAYRAPYAHTLDLLLQKMLQDEVWDYWMDASWGGDDPLGPYNIMYTGHLQAMMAQYRWVSGDTKYDETVTLDESGFSTSLGLLSAELYGLTLGNVDSNGDHYYGISCETGYVFVPCQTPHAYGLLVVDAMDGTTYGEAGDAWLAWARENMRADGAFFNVYHPFESPPIMDESPVGIYEAWTLIYTDPLDHTWTVEAYDEFLDKFVEDDAWGEGTAIVHNTPGESDPIEDLAATAFGMVLARELGDADRFEAFRASMDTLLGERDWSDDGRTWGYDSPLVPTVPANLHLLLALAITEDFTLRENLARLWSIERFDWPMLAEVSDPDAFVTAAWYDETSQELTLTVTGGTATVGPADLTIDQLDPDVVYAVSRDGEPFDDFSRDGETLIISTGQLSEDAVTWLVAPDDAGGSGDSGPGDTGPDGTGDVGSGEDPEGEQDSGSQACGCGAASGGAAWWLVALVAAVRRRDLAGRAVRES